MFFSMLRYATKRYFLSITIALCASFWVSSTATAQTSTPRVVSLTPHATEMLFAAGAGEFIVATVTSSDFPAQAQSIAKLGDGLNTSIEQVLGWQPDWVVGWPSALMTQLKGLGVETLVLEPNSLAEIATQVQVIGQALGTVSTAKPKSLRLSLQAEALGTGAIGTASLTGPAVRVAVLASPDARYVLGKHSLINETLTRCGAINVFADTLATAPSVSLESLLAAQPKLIFSGYTPPTWLTNQFEVAIIEPNWLYRPGPRFLRAAHQICAKVQQVGQSKK